ncbi:BMP family ABC transporter substrate-binding protein [Salipaludibacillus agaradhaerens]|uniref:BMP family ABC transporter substrate-binding protein n=1 Tax=Salipaludibacillus agaradhaerens TaxID=76935 RepID=UPI002151AA3D|nr:BMP family ABC transporter substrate-binding protein [Salipaludibacillus agaradhaerens]MCR6107344.1 BMP family ABC transporter substrate-binding protein [Salipaludibacillus agaradhaerens]MCR6119373.1 BMP family ABC transporter substrate-binding protein [Salipaludibacillus agaradhaerens]UJW58404.1 BMP family ABC transporter substrate-binding protein [Bacillus sp. A116_S68]
MKYMNLLIICSLLFLLTGCSSSSSQDLYTSKVGLLLPHTIDDQGWNSKGYRGMLKVQSSLNMEILMREDTSTYESVSTAVQEFVREDVSLIIGHSHIYADIFMMLKDEYPDIHFVSFNGDVEGDNITSLHFEGYAMGYFAGMLASELSETETIGVIGAFQFQPEVQGFKDGAIFHNPNTTVLVDYVDSWINKDKAITIFHDMKEEESDIFYPAGDGFHIDIIEEVKKEGLHAIGYVGDQLDLGESVILTSTVQEVEDLYEYIAKQYLSGELASGNQYFDFQEGVISLGEFGQEVPEETVQWLTEVVDTYIETSELPNEHTNVSY